MGLVGQGPDFNCWSLTTSKYIIYDYAYLIPFHKVLCNRSIEELADDRD